jgi:hypothetical protein
MHQDQLSTGVVEVAVCTAAAAHRRDHQHATHESQCHPHAVEVIHLGNRALAVCHDCGSDSGYLPHRDAERLAALHQQQTRSATVALPTLVAA